LCAHRQYGVGGRTDAIDPKPPSKQPKIGAKVVGHARYVNFQMAEVAVPKTLAEILQVIAELRSPPIASTE